MSLQHRLQHLINVRQNGSISAFAKACGIQEESVRQWLKGISKPSLDKIKAIAIACDVSLDWLVLDQQPADADMIRVQKLAFTASAGSGSVVLSELPERVPVSRALLQRLGLSAENARLLDASGDSMMPTIADGDPLIVEVGVDRVIDGRIHVFTVGNDAYVKRLRRTPGQLIMSSDNPDWPTEPVPAAEPFRLIGYVRWVGRAL